MDLTHKKIGIWGYGIVGKATTKYLKTKKCTLSVCDARILPAKELDFFHQNNIAFYSQTNIYDFLKDNDLVVPSPGIDLEPYKSFRHKWLSELDIFAYNWQKPIIAITGTVGKTTVTHLINLLFKHADIPISLGGNIGKGMLDLIKQQQKSSYAVLELSSWQLETCKKFAPTISLWTNFSENHLDRHGSMHHYFNAKYNIIAHQTEKDTAIIPLSLKKNIYKKNPCVPLIFFSCTKPKNLIIRPQDTIIYKQNNALYAHTQKTTCLLDDILIPDYSFTANWIALYALLYTLQLPYSLILALHKKKIKQDDRLEFVGVKKGISFYNDSKSTTPTSTLASIKKFAGKNMHLFLGGLSKGINREPLIKTLRNKNITVYCFGKESVELLKLCKKHELNAYEFTNLEKAFRACIVLCKPEDIVLFSPAGSSFDLYANYHERGTAFKQMIKSLVFL